MYTIVLSGPLAQRAPVLASLARLGADVDDQPAVHPSHGLASDDPTVGWVTCHHDEVDEVVERARHGGWSLRMHWLTPRCRVCGGLGSTGGAACQHCKGSGRTNQPAPSPEQLLRNQLEEMHQRLVALEAKGA